MASAALLATVIDRSRRLACTFSADNLFPICGYILWRQVRMPSILRSRTRRGCRRFSIGLCHVGVEYSWPGSRAFKASFFLARTPLTFSYSYIHGNLASSTSRPSKRTRETGLANLTITTSVLRIHASRGSQILFVGSGKLYGGAGPVYGGPKATVNPKGLSVAFASGILGKTINRRLCAFPGFSNWHTTQ
jgi:hypothetical protein